MSKKVYTLELTAEELENINAFATYGASEADKSYVAKLHKLQEQARADSTNVELRLPWKAVQAAERNWVVFGTGEQYWLLNNERQAKLKAAAPELLDAVNAWTRYMDDQCYDAPDRAECLRLTKRALHKVETGIPEED